MLATTFMPSLVYGEKIGDISRSSFIEQVIRFFQFQDGALVYALLGSLLLGACCGLLGSFIVVRRLSLVGDALSHAVLPGVAIGFLWKATKDPFAILLGATIAGLLGTSCINLLTKYTKLREDAAIGMVLASFFALGVTLLTIMQRMSISNKSGIQHYLFGQAAALTPGDIQMMAVVTIFSVIMVLLFFKEMLVVSFDTCFAKTIGIPTQWIHRLIMFLLAIAVVTALQAVGVVLVSAMLITPAATAYLLCKKLKNMIFVAMAIGIISGVLGALFSFLGNNLPTGPFMVLATVLLFSTVFLFAPRHGILVKWWKQRTLSHRTKIENTLKAIFHVQEQNDFKSGISLEQLAKQRRISDAEAFSEARALEKLSLITRDFHKNLILLTPEGWRRSCATIRNHRLWELYLNQEKDVPADQVHEEAEEIEHVLGEEVVRRLERTLKHPHLDPHGRPIPSLEDIWGEIPTDSHRTTSPGSYFRQGS